MELNKDLMVNYMKTQIHISKELELAIKSVIKIEAVKKDELLLKEGMIPHRLFMLQNGSARTFYYHNGKDVTSWIYRNEIFITAWGSFYARTPSHENIQILEDSVVHSIAYDDLQKLYAEYPKMQIFGRLLCEQQISFIDHFYKGFFFMTAKEKYDLLLENFPDVSYRVNLGYIASFLGISQETLSRIRRKR